MPLIFFVAFSMKSFLLTEMRAVGFAHIFIVIAELCTVLTVALCHDVPKNPIYLHKATPALLIFYV